MTDSVKEALFMDYFELWDKGTVLMSHISHFDMPLGDKTRTDA